MFGTWVLPYPNGGGIFTDMYSDWYFGTVDAPDGTTSDSGSLHDYHEDWDRCSGETVKAGAGVHYGYTSAYKRATGVFLSDANDEHGGETYSEWGSQHSVYHSIKADLTVLCGGYFASSFDAGVYVQHGWVDGSLVSVGSLDCIRLSLSQ